MNCKEKTKIWISHLLKQNGLPSGKESISLYELCWNEEVKGCCCQESNKAGDSRREVLQSSSFPSGIDDPVNHSEV